MKFTCFMDAVVAQHSAAKEQRVAAWHWLHDSPRGLGRRRPDGTRTARAKRLGRERAQRLRRMPAIDTNFYYQSR